ncbi:MAG: hypothetical protein QM493_02160 [Sulfurovum sp.]
MKREFVRYIHIVIFIILGLYMSGCTRYYNPAGTSYNKDNKYYKETSKTRTKSKIAGNKYYSKNNNKKSKYDDDYNDYDKKYNKKSKYDDDYNDYDKKYSKKSKYDDDYYNDYDKKYSKKSKYDDDYYNDKPVKNRKKRKNRTAKNDKRYNNRKNIYEKKPEIVNKDFTNDPRHNFHMNKKRFFYSPRKKIPYYYKDGVYYYGGSYSNGSYEYQGTTLTGGQYHKDRNK